ncbi:hypothetical protein ACFX1S_044025 [Malus domestica]
MEDEKTIFVSLETSISGSSMIRLCFTNSNVACEEYKCMGPGSSTYNERNLSKELTDKQVKSLISLGYIQVRRFYAHITFLFDSLDAFHAMFDGGIIF